jgi:hypothetical protein
MSPPLVGPLLISIGSKKKSIVLNSIDRRGALLHLNALFKGVVVVVSSNGVGGWGKRVLLAEVR